jgi:hypothetical protein
MKAIAVAVGVVLVLAGGVVFKLRSDANAELEVARAEQIRREQEYAKREQDNQRKYQAMLDQKSRELATAKSDEERNRIRKEMETEREKESARRARTPSRAPARTRRGTSGRGRRPAGFR